MGSPKHFPPCGRGQAFAAYLLINRGAEAGGRLCLVACSYEYASPMSVGSLHARPNNVTPAGSSPRVYPIGTVMAGNPVLGEKS